MGKQGLCEQLYFRLLDAHSVQDATLIDGFLYIYKGSTWQLIILRELQLNNMSAQNVFMQHSRDNTGNGDLDKTYQNVTDKYY